MPLGKRLGRLACALIAALALALPIGVTQAAPAQAAPVVGFNAGNIIADGVFYEGGAMSAGEIQSFLNARVPRCTIGDPGRLPGQAQYGSKVAKSCLKDARFSTGSRVSNAYCGSFAGAKNETGAQIIAKVAKSCGISPKVLLIMLEKEQSLVTDSWPIERQYDYAMGYNCPDSGPGNSANCDPGDRGFANQVYRSAWQLKVYKAHPTWYNYLPRQTNKIQWHPNAGCGTSNVYVENSATAALYIYTPYRPNQAALNAGWGEGNSCSSYGNRNFYNFFVSWFGNAQLPFAIDGRILDYWKRNSAWLGNPLAAAKSETGGRLQQFTGGTVYEPKTGETSGLAKGSPLLAAYGKAGGTGGAWGWPIAPAANQGGTGNTVMRFGGGTVVETNGIGVFLIPTVLQDHWTKSGGFNGTIGYPKANAVTGKSALAQEFRNGVIVNSAQGGVRQIDNRFLAAWRANGGLTSATGVPISGPVANAANGGGHTYELQAGTMYRTGAGVFTIPAGRYRNAYLAAGGVGGTFGWPTESTRCGLADGGCVQSFQKSVGMWMPDTGLVSVTPAVYRAWDSAAGEIGFPSGPPTAIAGGGTVQRFARGDVYTTSQGTFALPDGPIRDAYRKAGGPAGSWGVPASRMVTLNAGKKKTMIFSKGTLVWTADGGAVFSPNVPAAQKPVEPTTPSKPGDGKSDLIAGAVE